MRPKERFAPNERGRALLQAPMHRKGFFSSSYAAPKPQSHKNSFPNNYIMTKPRFAIDVKVCPLFFSLSWRNMEAL
ncbi:MAG: hypothetical protein PHI27_01710 [Eubacteriales bacterium]|nr:hypothetical protein [Eubacteriales bacterium]